jgi:hypothetical protein
VAIQENTAERRQSQTRGDIVGPGAGSDLTRDPYANRLKRIVIEFAAVVVAHDAIHLR